MLRKRARTRTLGVSQTLAPADPGSAPPAGGTLFADLRTSYDTNGFAYDGAGQQSPALPKHGDVTLVQVASSAGGATATGSVDQTASKYTHQLLIRRRRQPRHSHSGSRPLPPYRSVHRRHRSQRLLEPQLVHRTDEQLVERYRAARKKRTERGGHVSLHPADACGDVPAEYPGSRSRPLTVPSRARLYSPRPRGRSEELGTEPYVPSLRPVRRVRSVTWAASGWSRGRQALVSVRSPPQRVWKVPARSVRW